MNYKKSYKLILIILSITYIGCIKTMYTDNSIIDSEHITITALKEWISLQKNNATSISSQNNIDTLIKNANWEKTVQMSASNGNIIIYVPLNNSPVGLEFFLDHKTMKIDSGNIIRVVSQETSLSGEKILGSMAYYENIILKSNQSINFNGTITIFSILNKFKYDYTFWDGKLKSYGLITPKTESTKSNIRSNSLKLNLDCQEWGHYTFWTNGDVTLDYTYSVCGDDACKDVALNISDGDIQIRSNCTGNRNETEGPPKVNIWNNINDPCLKKLLDNVMSTVTKITTLLQKNNFGLNGMYALSYSNKNLYKSDLNAITKDIVVATDGIKYATIILNDEVLPFASQEFAAKTIMHEALHGMLTINGMKPSNSIQHNEIANLYVSDLTSSLMTLFGINENDATALAWSGLNDLKLTNVYFSIPLSKRLEYETIANQYWKGGTKGTRPKQGSCN